MLLVTPPSFAFFVSRIPRSVLTLIQTVHRRTQDLFSASFSTFMMVRLEHFRKERFICQIIKIRIVIISFKPRLKDNKSPN